MYNKNRDNIEIISDSICFGCTSCENSCVIGAIKMIENAHGFVVPSVDSDKCIGCGKCLEGCPAKDIQKIIPESDYKVYGAMGADEDRKFSSSGGIFPALARFVIAQGGRVCGCIMDDDLKVRHILTDNIQLVSRMSDSKYVQSNLGNVFDEILTELKQNRKVLFSGCSCQVDGLKKFLKTRNQSTEDLFCVDIICHGVPSPRVFSDYLKYYEFRRNDKIIGFKFRSKKYGWGDGIGACNYIQKIETVNQCDDSSFIARLWQNVFFSDLATRECCFKCPYTTLYKPSDITLGDYWGVSVDMPELADRKGTSLIITHGEKGEQLLSNISVHYTESRDYKKSIKCQSRLSSPVTKPKQYEDFWNDYEKGFDYLAKKFFKYSKLNEFKYYIKMKLYSMHLYRFANRIFRGILY